MTQISTLKDLKIAHTELVLRNKELKKCSYDLKLARKNIKDREVEKEKQVSITNCDLEEMMFTVSHKVRNCVANVIGISKMIFDDNNLEIHEWREMIKIIIISAESLNKSTEQLTKLIYKKKKCQN